MKGRMIVDLYRDAGLKKTLRILSQKAIRKAAPPVERLLVKKQLYWPVSYGFRDDWITMALGYMDASSDKLAEEVFTDAERNIIISAAEAICDRRFDFLGTGPMHFPETISWHTDFKSGYSWPLLYFGDIARDIGSSAYFDRGCDIKYPWELSRLHFLVTLGQAYRLTGDQGYYTAFARVIQEWTECNPFKLGCNWSCTMDVAIRGANLCVAATLFKELISGDPDLSQSLYRQLHDTGRFIAGHLEWDLNGHGNNHYLSNLAGLLFIGLMLRNTAPQGDKWINIAVSGLEREIRWQVNDDGGSFEGSLSYHRLSTEMFLWCGIVAERNGISLSQAYRSRLEGMCRFIRDYLKPNGLAPGVGDADDGRFLILNGYGNVDIRDHRHVLGVAGMFFNRLDFHESAGPCCIDAKWFYGKQMLDKGTAMVQAPLAVYPETGYVRYLKDGVYILVKCGPLGTKGIGTHDHNDQLSFELNINSQDLIIDSGLYTYTGNRMLRQQYRSVTAHNVTQYENHEQNIIRNESLGDLFCMYSHNSGEIIKAEETAQGFIFAGKMRQGESEVILFRTITLDTSQRMLRIEDYLEGAAGDSQNRTRIHLSSEIDDLDVQGRVACIKTDRAYVTIEASNAISLEKCAISPSYGVTCESTRLQWFCDNVSITVIKY